MIVSKELHNSWKEFFKGLGIYETAAEIGISGYTLRNALATGECKQSTYDKINSFIMKRSQSEKNIINEIKNGHD